MPSLTLGIYDKGNYFFGGSRYWTIRAYNLTGAAGTAFNVTVTSIKFSSATSSPPASSGPVLGTIVPGGYVPFDVNPPSSMVGQRINLTITFTYQLADGTTMPPQTVSWSGVPY